MSKVPKTGMSKGTENRDVESTKNWDVKRYQKQGWQKVPKTRIIEISIENATLGAQGTKNWGGGKYQKRGCRRYKKQGCQKVPKTGMSKGTKNRDVKRYQNGFTFLNGCCQSANSGALKLGCLLGPNAMKCCPVARTARQNVERKNKWIFRNWSKATRKEPTATERKRQRRPRWTLNSDDGMPAHPERLRHRQCRWGRFIRRACGVSTNCTRG